MCRVQELSVACEAAAPRAPGAGRAAPTTTNTAELAHAACSMEDENTGAEAKAPGEPPQHFGEVP